MRHLDPEPSAAYLAESAHAAALLGGALELLQLAAVEIEKAQHHAVGVHDELAAGPEGDFGLVDARFDEHRLSGWRPLRSGQRGFILVAQRKVQHEIEARAQPEFLECSALHPACRMASISTSAPRGSPATPTAAREG